MTLSGLFKDEFVSKNNNTKEADVRMQKEPRYFLAHSPLRGVLSPRTCRFSFKFAFIAAAAAAEVAAEDGKSSTGRTFSFVASSRGRFRECAGAIAGNNKCTLRQADRVNETDAPGQNNTTQMTDSLPKKD